MDQASQIYSSDVAFTPSVKAVQARKGSRAAYARMERGGSWATHITARARRLHRRADQPFLATANADGQPYIQHRGGPPGFLRVLDDTTSVSLISSATSSSSPLAIWRKMTRRSCF